MEGCWALSTEMSERQRWAEASKLEADGIVISPDRRNP